MPKQIKQMKISQRPNQVKTHRQIVLVLVGEEGKIRERGQQLRVGAVSATNAVLNRHQLGIKLLFFGNARLRLRLRLRLGSMTTFFCAPPLSPFPSAFVPEIE